MCDPHIFAIDVFRLVCDRFKARAADLQLMAETTSSFEEWLNWEAFLGCKLCEASYPFCEVTAKPTYNSEGVLDGDGRPDRKQGDLRAGGSYDADDHRWVFAEFALLHDGNRTGDEWRTKIEKDVSKLHRLRWKRSVSMLIVVAVSKDDILTGWASYLANFTIWNQPALTDPFTLALPGGGSLVVKAFDVKQDTAYTITMNPN